MSGPNDGGEADGGMLDRLDAAAPAGRPVGDYWPIPGDRVTVGEGTAVGTVLPVDAYEVEVRWDEGDTTLVAASDLRCAAGPVGEDPVPPEVRDAMATVERWRKATGRAGEFLAAVDSRPVGDDNEATAGEVLVRIAVSMERIANAGQIARTNGLPVNPPDEALRTMASALRALAATGPAPCPYIVSSDEGTSHCSLAAGSGPAPKNPYPIPHPDSRGPEVERRWDKRRAWDEGFAAGRATGSGTDWPPTAGEAETLTVLPPEEAV